MFWWFTEPFAKDKQNNRLSMLWTPLERRAAIRAWVMLVAIASGVQAPLDYYLTFDSGLGDVISSGAAAGCGWALGMLIAYFVAPRIWPVLSRPRGSEN